MPSLPQARNKRHAVKVSKDAERHIRAGHPWIYDQSIASDSLSTLDQSGEPGDLAVVFDHNRKFLAIGLLDPLSPIRIKLLHHGKPLTVDEEFWHNRVSRAIGIRETLESDPATTAYRLINGESDGLPGLIVDLYAQSIVLKLYSSAWIPYLEPIVRLLAVQTGAERIVLRLARLVSKQETFGLTDGVVFAPPVDGEGLRVVDAHLDPVQFLENGLSMSADLVRGQKTGHFLDQRENRAMVHDLAVGGRVLDVFACTGGFGLNAAAGGAVEVTAIDQSSSALANVERNFQANQDRGSVSSCQLVTKMGDAFQELEHLAQRGAKFDLVVLDPPSFAQKKGDVARAEAAYDRLTRLGLGVVAPGGVFVQASCSSRVSSERFFDGVQVAATKAGYDLRPFASTGHALDHPATFPEARYLKAVFARPAATIKRHRVRP